MKQTKLNIRQCLAIGTVILGLGLFINGLPHPGSAPPAEYWRFRLVGGGIAFLGAYVYLRASSRPPRPFGTCFQCGYDLTGNTSGRCPECGRSL